MQLLIKLANFVTLIIIKLELNATRRDDTTFQYQQVNGSQNDH
jgi:hypothetical protein